MSSPDEMINKLTQEIEDLKSLFISERRKNTNSINNLKKLLDDQGKAHAEIHNAVYLLQDEKTNLRKAVHKLKLRNGMMARKLNKIKDRIKSVQLTDKEGEISEDDFDLIDYDDIGRNFLIIGWKNDPLAFGYNVKIKDDDGNEHSSAEKYYWYMMAEHFNDKKSMDLIKNAVSYQKADEVRKSIIGYDEQIWNKVKLEFYTKAQEKKFEQNRFLRNILILTNNTYLAVASDDKFFGTGWRKQREESQKPLTWDGENNGGKVLMHFRKRFTKNHEWLNEEERRLAEAQIREMRRVMWRRSNNNYDKNRSGFVELKSKNGNLGKSIEVVQT